MSVNSLIDSWHKLGDRSAPTNLDRFDKSKNPNWTRICDQILGFKEFKHQQYQSITCQIRIIG
ncbi:hypothetical protein ACP6PL_27480 [Dapis sp. BLCC M126]|uniref:hypothetical protein n=1 Tax=Dapis sp. BLCC M126 TaxID=3400189 RepID=UPI003CE92668